MPREIVPDFKASEVRKILNTNAEMISRLIAKGELKAYKVGKQWRIPPASVEAYKAKHAAVPNCDPSPRRKKADEFVYMPGMKVV